MMKTSIRHIIAVVVLCLLCATQALSQQNVPEAAKKHFQSGVDLIGKANNPANLLDAMAEFEKAATVAPMWSDIHYNMAMLAAEIDKPAKAIKEYQIYLALNPQAADRTKVEGEISRMKELIVRKRRIGLPGVKFASMKDGIAVLEVYPGAKVTKTLVPLRKGHTIVAVNNTSVVGMSLDNFFKTIEKSTQDAVQASTTARLYARGARSDRTPGELVMLKVKYPGIERESLIPCKKDMFRSRIVEIEEDEFDHEVLKEIIPVVVTFWSSDCHPCSEVIPVVETESEKYAGKVKFVNINTDENKNIVRQLAVKDIPSIIVFKRGKAVSTDSGKLDGNRVTTILKNAGSAP